MLNKKNSIGQSSLSKISRGSISKTFKNKMINSTMTAQNGKINKFKKNSKFQVSGPMEISVLFNFCFIPITTRN
jgi:ethanolamine utilization protein EutQ (cupin superfamily)